MSYSNQVSGDQNSGGGKAGGEGNVQGTFLNLQSGFMSLRNQFSKEYNRLKDDIKLSLVEKPAFNKRTESDLANSNRGVFRLFGPF